MNDVFNELLEDEERDLKKIKKDRLLKEKSKKNILNLQNVNETLTELRNEEETLTEQLDQLRRENFILEVSINSLQTTLETKLAEFHKSETQLNDLYTEIWKKREKFCSEAQHLDIQFDVLSSWWKAQMDFVADLDKLDQKHEENKGLKEEIQAVETKIREKKNQIKELTLQQADFVVHLPESGEPDLTSTDPEDCKAEQEMLSRWSTKKKVTFVDNEVESKEIIEAYEEPEVEPPNNELFSLMDLNKMKMLKKLRNASGHSSNL
ncbi:hypothetical protein RUM43_012264 [Polyplax serrata]|uniref:Uncharacterized protein n=1 Tax=Polyplax serrata TaxID=468196 RepID=A0AAN8P6X2_POLSC